MNNKDIKTSKCLMQQSWLYCRGAFCNTIMLYLATTYPKTMNLSNVYKGFYLPDYLICQDRTT